MGKNCLLLRKFGREFTTLIFLVQVLILVLFSQSAVSASIISQAYWDPITASNHEEVSMTAWVSSSYNGQTVTFEIYEHDTPPLDPNDYVATKYATVENGHAVASWITEWQEDKGADPEYIFKVILKGEEMWSATDLLISQDTEVRYYAVIVGEEDYPPGWVDNKFPDIPGNYDAAFDIFNNLNFPGRTTKAYLPDATKTKIKDTIEAYGNMMDKGDIFFFFYAGHGNYYDGDYWLVPVGTKAEPSTSEMIRSTELKNWLDGLPTSRIAVILSSCFSGGIAHVLCGAPAAYHDYEVLTICQGTESATTWHATVFNRFLIQGLKGSAMDYYNEVTINSLSPFISKGLYKTYEHPTLDGGDAYFSSDIVLAYNRTSRPYIWENQYGSGMYDGYYSELKIEIPEDAGYVIDLTQYENDREDTGASLKWKVSGLDHCSVSGENSSDDKLTFSPYKDFNGTDVITLSLHDSDGNSTSKILVGWKDPQTIIYDKDYTLTITWTPVNDAPVIAGLPDQSLNESQSINDAFNLDDYAYDVESPDSALTYSIVVNTNKNCGVSIDSLNNIDISPTRGWYGYSDVTIRVSDPEGLVDEDTFRITVNKTQYYLTVNSPYGTTGGAGWYDDGATAYATLSTGTVSGGPGIQYVFTNWGGDASGTNYAKSKGIIMNSDKTATANWETQYYITLTENPKVSTMTIDGDNYSASQLPQSRWWDSGSGHTVSVQSLVTNGTNEYIFSGWDDGNTDNPRRITVSAAKTYTANFIEIIPTNHAPTLSWTKQPYYTNDGLDPETGYPDTDFVYRVNYVDQDNDGPASAYPRVHIMKGGSAIEGSPFVMSEVDPGDTTYTDEKHYYYTKAGGLGEGTDYTYYFEAKDVWDASATGTPTSPVDAPDIFPPLSGPDLIVESITIGPTSPVAGQSATVTVTIKNQGGATASGFFITYLYIDPPSVPKVSDEGDKGWDLDVLAAGQIHTFPSYSTTFTAGTHNLYAQVDSYDQIDEGEDGNNILKKTITVIEEKKPEVSLSKTSLNFSAAQGGSNPSDETFTITNSGPSGSALNWTGTDDAAWVNLSSTSGSLGRGQSETVTVSVDISGLSAGTCSGMITVSDPDATNSPQFISVTLTITPAARPVLEVSTLSFGFGEIPKPASETRKFTISNSGGGALEGTITSDRPWIRVKPTSFDSNNVTVFVTAHTDTLEVWKTYTGTVTIDSNGGIKTIDISVLPTCVKTYPNPYSLSSGKPLTFWGTGVAYATIKIYTLSGELVKTLKETDEEDKITWDGRNEKGERIVRGIYFFTTKSPRESNKGKFTVIR